MPCTLFLARMTDLWVPFEEQRTLPRCMLCQPVRS